MAIDKKLIFWKKQSTFNAPSSITDTTGSVMWYSIVFFKDTGQIWTNGTYYNCGIWGTPQTNYVPLTIGGTTYNLSRDGHTHAYFNRYGPNAEVYDINSYFDGIRTGYQWVNAPLGGIGTLQSIVYSNDWISQEFTSIGSIPSKFIRCRHSGTTWGDWNLFWHSGNSNLSTRDWTVKDLKASNKIFLTATSGARDILIGNQDSVGVNNPAIIRGVNGAIYLGGGTNWTDGGTFTANMIIQDNGDVSVTNTISANSFVKSGSSNSYILLGGGGQKLITDFDQYEANLKWGGKDFSGSYGCIDAAMVPFLGANRLAFANASGITIEYSRDSGMTWIDYGASDAQKLNLTSGADSSELNIGKADSTNKDNGTYQLRITINTGVCSIYTQLNKFCIYLSTNGSTGVTCTIEGALQASPDSYAIFKNSIPVSGWSGYNIINTSSFTTYGNTPASQYGRIRFTFRSTGGSTTYNGLTVKNIFGYGGVGWVTPSNMARWGQIYSYNSSQEVTFPAKVTATSFSGNATSATKVTSTLTRGSYLTGSNFDGSAATTWAVDATSANTASKVVARDSSGNFSAGIITATSFNGITGLNGTGSATTASKSDHTHSYLALTGGALTGALSIKGAANTFEYALRLAKGNYADTGGHTTLIGFGAESVVWSKTAIGHTRTGSYDRGYLGFYVNGASDTTSATASDLKMSINSAGDVAVVGSLSVGTITSTGNVTASNLWGIASKNISLTLTTSWQDTGILMNDATLFAAGSGTYAIELSSNTPTVSAQYDMIYSGIMAVYIGATNHGSDVDEIVLHSMGHASNDRHIYLRTMLQVTPNYAKIQIASSADWSGAGTITIKTRRIL